MGSYTSGEMEISFSDKLTDDEIEQWVADFKTPPHYGECPSSYCSHFEPESWAINEGLSYGEDCEIDIDAASLTIYVGYAKCYDFEEMVDQLLRTMPARITASGQGFFSTEGEQWGVQVSGRDSYYPQIVLAPISEDCKHKPHPLEKFLVAAQKAADEEAAND